MKIAHISFGNFRNIKDLIEVSFDKECNFVVGENNCGKSNILSLLNGLFNSRGFKREDFNNPNSSIEVQLSLVLDEIEIGHFSDLFDATDYRKINITARQSDPEDSIHFFHKESGTAISSAKIKMLNFIHYDSLRNPINEINFDKGKGVGKFLRSVIERYLNANDRTDASFVNSEEITPLIDDINEKLQNIKPMIDFGISADIDHDVANLVSRIISLKDPDGQELYKSGYGVQFLILVTLSVLEKINFICSTRGEKGIFTDVSNGEKAISVILALDEPEIHLHPFMQRSLIKYLNSIISNKNEDFSKLVLDLFGINRFVGQIIAATHSPNIVLNDYRQIIRIYKKAGTVEVVSGASIILDPQEQKHLLLQFPFIKEAMFSRCIAFVEGDSEYAAFPIFAQKLGYNFDDLGITVIQARGDAIEVLIRLASQFRIPAIGIGDRDDNSGFVPTATFFRTILRDFEQEILEPFAQKRDKILSILQEYDSLGIEREMTWKSLNKHAIKRYKLRQTDYSINLKFANINESNEIDQKAFYLTWLSVNKSQPLGLLIGKILHPDDIPIVYKDFLTLARNLATV